MSAYKIQAPGNYPEESIQHSEHSESLESGIIVHLLIEKFCSRCVLYETQRKAARAFKLDNVDAFTQDDTHVLFLYIARILRKILMRFVSIIIACPDDD
jgi:hypothetical protein